MEYKQKLEQLGYDKDMSLVDIITSCGLRFSSLVQYQKPIGTVSKWGANSYFPLPAITAYGQTPEEAVTNLLMEINNPQEDFDGIIYNHAS